MNLLNLVLNFCAQGTFKGRLRHFLDVIDPRTLFTSKVSENIFACMYEYAHANAYTHIHVCAHEDKPLCIYIYDKYIYNNFNTPT